MRENRPYGSEGGAGFIPCPYPYLGSRHHSEMPRFTTAWLFSVPRSPPEVSCVERALLTMAKVVVKVILTNYVDEQLKKREYLDFVVDPKGRKLIPNPEHGDKQMSEEY